MTKINWYKKWHDFRFAHHFHVLILALYIVGIVVGSIAPNPGGSKVYAASGSWPQTTFNGTSDGTYTNTVAANTNADIALAQTTGGINSFSYNKQITFNTSSTGASVGLPINIATNGATCAANVATISVSPTAHGYNVGDSVTVAGVSQAIYNGTFTIASVPSPTSFTYSDAGCSATGTGGTTTHNLTNFPIAVHVNASSWPISAERTSFFGAWNAGGKRIRFYDADATTNLPYEVDSYRNASATIAASPTGASRASNVVTITTSSAHGYMVGDVVVISGVTVGATSFNGTFTISAVPSTTTFQYAQTGTTETSGSGTAIVQDAVYWVKVPQLDGNTSGSNADHIHVGYGNDVDGTDYHGYASYALQTQAVWDSNFKMVQHFPNGTSLSANDSTANGHNGTIVGATATSGLVGGAASFNGTSNEINYPTSADWDFGTSDFTLEATYTPISPVSDQILIMHGAGAATGKYSSWCLRYDPVGHYLMLYRWANVTEMYQQVSWTPTDGVTYRISVAKTATGVSFYVNNAQLGSTQTTSIDSTYNRYPTNSTELAHTGMWYSGGGSGTQKWLKGTVDEIRVSSGISRSADWIKLEYYTMKKTNFNGDNGVSAPFISWGNQTLPAYVSSGTYLSGLVPDSINPTHAGKIYQWTSLAFSHCDAGHNTGQTPNNPSCAGTYTNTSLHIHIYQSDGVTLVPDSDLSGNAAGFTASPIPLTTLNNGLYAVKYSALKVRADFASTDGIYSPLLSDWTATYSYDTTAPTVPTGLTVSAASSTSMTVSWAASTDSDSNLAGYEVQRASDSSGIPGTWTTPGGTCAGTGGLVPPATPTVSCTDSGLSPNSKYFYRVRAKDNVANYSNYGGTSATGGAITTYGNYTVHTFTSGTSTFDVTSGNLIVDYLVVGGGGGGGYTYGGGGGGGGVLSGSAYTVASPGVPVVVGAGGTAPTSAGGGTTGGQGGTSSFNNISAIGGGGGANALTSPTTGGSGGGGAGLPASYGGSPIGANGTAGQGNAGGNGANSTSGVRGAGGGGGAGTGAVGGAGTTSVGGNGGSGVISSIAGLTTCLAEGTAPNCYYGGGGGGGIFSDSSSGAGTGGAGGGGLGGTGGRNGAVGINNTGGGGGGGGQATSSVVYSGAAGGSGIVIIRYLTGVSATTLVATPSLTAPTTPQGTNKPTISGTGATPNTWVNLYDNGVAKATVQADGSGNFTFNSSTSGYTALTEGNRTNITVKGSNSASPAAETPNSNQVSVYVDTTPPTITSSTLTVPNGGEKWKGGSSQNITWNSAGITDAGSGPPSIKLDYSTDGGSTFPNSITTGVANTGSYTWTVPPLDSATIKIRLTAYDALGNSLADYSDASFLIDSTAPTVPGVPTATSPTSNNKPTISWTGSTDTGGSGVASYTLCQDTSPSGSFFTCNTVASPNLSYPYVSSLSDGTWYFKVKATDNVSNISSLSNFSSGIVIDTTAPTVANVSVSNPSFSPNASTGSKDNTAISYVITDNNSGNLSAILKIYSSADPINPIKTISGTKTQGYQSEPWDGKNDGGQYVPDGSYTYYLTATDAAGNTNSPAQSGTIVVDNALPTLLTSPPVHISSNNSDHTMATAGNEISLTFTASEAISNTPSVTIDGHVAAISSTSPNFTAKYVMAAGDPDGPVTFEISNFMDNAGNTGNTVSATNDGSGVTLDKAAPTYSGPLSYSISSRSVRNGDTQTISAVFSKNMASGASTPKISIDYAGTGSDVTNAAMTQGSDAKHWAYDASIPSGNDGTATVTISGTDTVGNQVSGNPTNNTFTVDNTAPTITNVTSTTANGLYKTGAVIDVRVTFSENVVVTGTPQITLETGTTDRVVNYVSGSGTNTLLFNYTVQTGDTTTDLDYQSTSALALNGGTIKDNATNNATLTLASPGAAGSLGSNKDIVVDTVPPTITSVTSNSSNGSYKAGVVIDVRVIFSENVVVTGTPQITLETGTTDRIANYTIGSGTNTLVFNYTVQAGDTSADLDYQSTSALALNGGTIKDAAANDATLTLASPGATNSLGANKDIVIDTAAPTTNVSISRNDPTVVEQNGYMTTTPTFTLTASEGGTTYYKWGTGSTYSTYAAPISNMEQGTHTLYWYTTDTAGNPETPNSQEYKLDSVAPTGSFTIGDGSGYTKETSGLVDLTVAAMDAVSGMNKIVVSMDGLLFDSSSSSCTLSYATSIIGWDLNTQDCGVNVSGDGSKTIYMKFTDQAGNLSPTAVSETITLDVTAPNNPGQTLGFSTPSVSIADLASSNWAKYANPKFTWSAGTDDTSGMKGYYVYFGTDAGSDPEIATDSSNLAFADNANNNFYDKSVRQYIVTSAITSGQTYYLKLKSRDNALNVGANNYIEGENLFVYKFDNTKPGNITDLQANPSTYSSVDNFNFVWTQVEDSGSGLNKYQYHLLSGTDSWHDWPKTAINNRVTLTNIRHYKNDDNKIEIKAVDAAGNESDTITGFYRFSGDIPAPEDVRIDSSQSQNNTVNKYSFSWKAPTGITPQGYYYSINEIPSASSANYVPFVDGQDTTTIGPLPFATKKGLNTFYVVTMAHDVVGWNNYENPLVTFTCDSTAPGIPQNVMVSDASSRDSQRWQLTVNWDQPADITPDFDRYIIEQATDYNADTNTGHFKEIATVIKPKDTIPPPTGYLDTNLVNISTYAYRVMASDKVGNKSAPSSVVSKQPTGRYTTPPKLIGEPKIVVQATKATLTYVTERDADSFVQIGTNDKYGMTQGQLESTSTHEVSISGLTPGVFYHYRAMWRDQDGNIGYSKDYTFKTQDAPGISEVTVSDIRLTSAIISWKTTTVSSSNVMYGTSNSYGANIEDKSGSNVTTHVVKLDSLADSTTYHFKISGTDVDGNVLNSDDYSFETLTFPRISGIKIEQQKNTATSTIKVTWNSNVPVDSVVEYAQSGGSTREVSKSTLETKHSLTVSGLRDNTRYVVTVKGRDQYGNEVDPSSQEYKTDFDTRPPEISSITTETSIVGYGTDAKGQVIVSWNTDEPSTSQVEYGVGVSGDTYAMKTQEDGGLTTSHVVVISGLKTSTSYHFRVVSKDASNNQAMSEDNSILTDQASSSVLDVIVNSLQSTIGWIFSAFGRK